MIPASKEVIGNNAANEFIVKGCIAYVPRELQLNATEMMGAGDPYENDVESDFDLDLEESDEDPEEEFMNEVEEMFNDSVATQQLHPRPVDDFIKNLSNEIKSCKLTYNCDNAVAMEILVPCVLKTITTEFVASAEPMNAKDRSTLTLNKIKIFKDLIREFCNDNIDEEKILIEEIELFCGRDPAKGKKKDEQAIKLAEAANQLQFHIILQCFLQFKVLSKQAVLNWGEKAAKSVQGDEEKKEGDTAASTQAGADSSENENDEEEQDENLEIIGIEMRAKFLKDMQKTLDHLKTVDDNKKDESSSEESSSDSDSSDSDKSDDSDKDKAKEEAAPASKDKGSSGSSSSSSSGDSSDS